MIKDPAYWRNWESRTVLREPPDFYQNLKLIEAMYNHARRLGAFTRIDPLVGLGTKLHLAKALNVRTDFGTTCLLKPPS